MRFTFGCFLLTIAVIPFLRASKDQAPAEPLPPGVIRILSAPSFRHTTPVRCLEVTGGGKQLVTGTWHEGVILWDVAKGKRLKTLTPDGVMRLALAPAGDLLAVDKAGAAIIVHDLANGKERFSIKTDFYPPALAFAPDGGTLATAASHDFAVRLWKTADGTDVGVLKGHGRAVNGLAFHLDGKLLFSASSDGTVRQWDVATGKELQKLTEDKGWRPIALALSEDGKSLAVVAGGGTTAANHRTFVRLLDAATLKERFSKELNKSWPEDVALSSDGRYLAIALSESAQAMSLVQLWDTSTGESIRLDKVNGMPVYTVRFLDGGKTLVSAGEDGAVRVWNVADGTERSDTRGPTGPVRALAMAPGGKVLASAHGDRSVKLWDTVKGVVLHSLNRGEGEVDELVFSPDGALVVTVQADQGANLWDVRTGAFLRNFQSIARQPVFTPDGKTLVAAEMYRPDVVFWDVAKGTEQRRLRKHSEPARFGGWPLSALAVSPDGRLLASAGTDHTIVLWHLPTGVWLKTLPIAAQHVQRVWFSPDGALLFVSLWSAVPGRDPEVGDVRHVIAFETFTGEAVVRFDFAHHGPQAFWLAPGAVSLVACSAPGKFRALDLATGKALGAELAHGGDFIKAEFTPDGRMLALGYEDGRLLLWQPPPLPPHKLTPVALNDAKVKELWDTLAGGDAKLAYAGRWLLTAAPKQTLPLLRAKLRPQELDTKQVATWVAQLESGSFKEREVAMRELEKVGQAVEGTLRQALGPNVTLEMRRRIELILPKLVALPTGETLRSLRAIVILEAIGGDEARAILGALAKGAPGARTTEAAQGALKRI